MEVNQGIVNLAGMEAYNLPTVVCIILVAAFIMGVIILYNIFGGYFGVRLE